MPSSAVCTFTDHDEYFAGIPNLQLEGLVERRGRLGAEPMHIDLHRPWMHPLQRGPAPDHETLGSECARCPTRKIVRLVVGALPAPISPAR